MKKLIVTLSREYGSGGLEIGRALAEALGLPCYDKKLLSIAAEKSGFSEELLRQAESKAWAWAPTGRIPFLSMTKCT